jgi:hypothetical protein
MKKYISAFSLLVFHFSLISAQTWSSVGNNIKGNFTQFITCNNRLYANGIDSLNGKAVSFAYWDGNLWHKADSALPGQITALGVYKGKLYAGATEKSGANAVYRLMVWNDTLWNNVSTLNGPINSLMAFNGCLYAGGKFTMADTTRAKYIAKWNDTTWYPVGRGLSNNVRALAVYHSKIYAGGQFGEVVRFDGKSWETVLGSKNSVRMDGWVKAFCVYNEELYACGEFNYLAKWNDIDWTPVGSLNDGASAIAACNGYVYAGGDFTSSPAGNYVNHISGYNAATMLWNCLGGVVYSGGDCKPYNGTVWALAEYKGDLYIGGQFMIAGGLIINNIARIYMHKKN